MWPYFEQLDEYEKEDCLFLMFETFCFEWNRGHDIRTTRKKCNHGTLLSSVNNIYIVIMKALFFGFQFLESAYKQGRGNLIVVAE